MYLLMPIICNRSTDTLLKPRKHNMTHFILELFFLVLTDFLDFEA